MAAATAAAWAEWITNSLLNIEEPKINGEVGIPNLALFVGWMEALCN
ncbi:hypothetical protein Cflav_PD4720 [Pedosphaera parvula Ellin514]|uniref:Uncharacterized protein n=1 Tax=Pedosphaera parvula (strain Ellin514) TaxID=320771 RepID=B9XEG6_PEDPL|nr:hypothetical protein Cflav_PD4720 [Pedosphaera parvula Ellin514]